MYAEVGTEAVVTNINNPPTLIKKIICNYENFGSSAEIKLPSFDPLPFGLPATFILFLNK